MKKTLAVLLTLCMVITVFAPSAFAFSKKVIPTADVKMVKGEDFANSEIDAFKDFANNYAKKYKVNLKSTVGAVLTVDNSGSGYDDWYVDTVLTLSDDADVKLYGRYDTLDTNWYGSDILGAYASKLPQSSALVDNLDKTTGLISLTAGDYCVMKECGINRTVKTVADEVQTFYCICAVDASSIDTDVTVSLELYITDDFEEYTPLSTTQNSDTVSVTYTKTLPTAEIKMINGADFANSDIQAFKDFANKYNTLTATELEYTVGAVLTLNDTGVGYDDYFVDTLLTLDEDVTAKLYGRYDNYSTEWVSSKDGATFASKLPQGSSVSSMLNTQTGEVSFTAGTYAIMKELGFIYDVKAVENEVGTFYCVFSVDPNTIDSDLDLGLDLKIYSDKDNPEYIDVLKTEDSTAIAKTYEKVLPTADVKMVKGSDFATCGIEAFSEFATQYPEINANDLEYTIGAVLSVDDKGAGYDNYYVDTILNVDSDVSAKLYGKYDSYEGGWVGSDDSEFSAYMPIDSAFQGKIDADGNISFTAGDYAVMDELGFNLKVSAVNDDVKTFYCILVVDKTSIDNIANVGLDVKLCEDIENPVYIDVAKTEGSDTVAATMSQATLPTATATVVYKGEEFAGVDVFDEIEEDGYDIGNARGVKFAVANNNGGYGNSDIELGFEVTAGNIHGAILYYDGSEWQIVKKDMFYENEPVQFSLPAKTLLKNTNEVYVAFVHDTVTVVDDSAFDFVLFANDGNTNIRLADAETTINFLRIYDFEDGASFNLCLNDTVEKIINDATEKGKISDNDSVNIFSKDGTRLKSTDTITTGCVVRIVNTDTMEKTESTVVIKGDVNCDGDFTVQDYTQMVNLAVGKSEETANYIVDAADVNDDGVVDVLDAFMAEKFINNQVVYEDVIRKEF